MVTLTRLLGESSARSTRQVQRQAQKLVSQLWVQIFGQLDICDENVDSIKSQVLRGFWQTAPNSFIRTFGKQKSKVSFGRNASQVDQHLVRVLLGNQKHYGTERGALLPALTSLRRVTAPPPMFVFHLAGRMKAFDCFAFGLYKVKFDFHQWLHTVCCQHGIEAISPATNFLQQVILSGSEDSPVGGFGSVFVEVLSRFSDVAPPTQSDFHGNSKNQNRNNGSRTASPSGGVMTWRELENVLEKVCSGNPDLGKVRQTRAKKHISTENSDNTAKTADTISQLHGNEINVMAPPPSQPPPLPSQMVANTKARANIEADLPRAPPPSAPPPTAPPPTTAPPSVPGGSKNRHDLAALSQPSPNMPPPPVAKLNMAVPTAASPSKPLPGVDSEGANGILAIVTSAMPKTMSPPAPTPPSAPALSGSAVATTPVQNSPAVGEVALRPAAPASILSKAELMAVRNGSQMDQMCHEVFNNFYLGDITLNGLVKHITANATSSDFDKQFYKHQVTHAIQECRFLPKYPEVELTKIAELLGRLMFLRLCPPMTLGFCLRFVLEALRRPVDSKMFLFGILAIEEILGSMWSWPKICNHLVERKLLSKNQYIHIDL